MNDASGQPLAGLEVRLARMRSELESDAVVAHAAQAKAVLAEIEAAVAQRAELAQHLNELVARARHLGVPLHHLQEALGVSRRAFFKQYPG